MSEAYFEHCQIIKEANKADAQHNRELAFQEFPDAAALASEHGIDLLHRTDAHYQLRTRDWIINLYPGNGRIFSDTHKRGPFLRLLHPWTLLDAVKAAIEAGKGVRA